MADLPTNIARYLDELLRRGASKHTVRNYGSDLSQFAEYFEPPGETKTITVSEVDLALLREWLTYLYEQGLDAVSVRRKMASVRAFFKYPVQEGELTRNVAARLRSPKIKQRLPDVMSAEKT